MSGESCSLAWKPARRSQPGAARARIALQLGSAWSDRFAREQLNHAINSTIATQQTWRTLALAGMERKMPLYNPVLQAVESNNCKTAPRLEPVDCLAQKTLKRAELIIGS